LNENSAIFPTGPSKMSSCRQQKPASGDLYLSRGQDSSLDTFNREHYMVLIYCSSVLMFNFFSFRHLTDMWQTKKPSPSPCRMAGMDDGFKIVFIREVSTGAGLELPRSLS
jgi:hypothetical protein